MEEAQALVHLGVGGGWTRSEPTWTSQQATGGGAGLLFSLGQHLSVLQHKQRSWVWRALKDEQEFARQNKSKKQKTQESRGPEV